MSRAELQRLIPNAAPILLSILDGSRGAIEPPIRSEIFGPQRFSQHGRSLGVTHRADDAASHAATFFPRLRSNIDVLRQAHTYIGRQASTGYDISLAAEWLLDNFHLIEAQLKEIHEGLPRSYFTALPVLLDEPLAGLPRVYGVAWAFVAHTDGAFDDDLLKCFLTSYQETRELNLSEMWALPTTLRVLLIESLRRLAERVAASKAAREIANLCCDRIDTFSSDALDQLLVLLNKRGVGRGFLVQMAQRLQHHRPTDDSAINPRHLAWLRVALPDLAAAQAQQAVDQAADNLSVSNAINSLRSIGDADWPEIVAQTSRLMQLMLTSSIFASEDVTTRDHTLHGIERLARRSRYSERQVADALLGLMHSEALLSDAPNAANGANYWLRGTGQQRLLQVMGASPSGRGRWFGVFRRYSLPIYLLALLLGTLGLVAAMLSRHAADGNGGVASVLLTLCAVTLILFPASETVVAVINRLISESARPTHLPRLALAGGIPADHRVLVVIPAMLSCEATARDLVHQLQLHYLANAEENAQFALLSDWTDADSQHTDSDQAVLDCARAGVRELNATYPPVKGNALRFVVLHRERRFSQSEQRWIGWERKRGKLELLIAALAEHQVDAFIDLGVESRVAPGTPYVVTLDSDTLLPPGRLRELVGVAAHPQNQPRLDDAGRKVIGGYGILQPRVVTPLPAPTNFTLFHWLFAGQCGIDPYSAASSEVYQDVFGEGTFTGKGLLNVRAMYAVLHARLPEGQVLSHDLLEGAIARCAAVTDITLVEDAPTHADVAASRVHRWTRGDWQLLPLLLCAFKPGHHYAISAINRWKMFDNLRRSLVAPMSLALLLFALATSIVSPWAALALILAAFSAGPLMGAFAGLAPSRDDVAKRHFYAQAATDLVRAAAGGLWHLALLLNHALLSVDAITRSLYRMIVSHRNLLQWTTAAAAQASAQTSLRGLVWSHRSLPPVALLLLAGLLLAQTRHPWLATALCLLWAASPLWIWWVSRARLARTEHKLARPDHEYLEGVARDTWRLFERCIGADDNFLPPDNLQTLPNDAVAHRTSPTNMGLYLLSVACARQFGWIGTEELLSRIESTFSALRTLQRHRGHFLNWYDTQTRLPLLPMYVSTVDSGNLSGHLLAVAQSCVELSLDPMDHDCTRRAIRASSRRLAPLLHVLPELQPALVDALALRQLLAWPDPLLEFHSDAAAASGLLQAATAELRAQTDSTTDFDRTAQPSPRDQLLWGLGDHLATLRSAWQDCQTIHAQGEAAATQRLRSLARELEALAWEADFSFLYHPKRHLFHIGYRVAEQQLDAGFYDLLASESRLTSLLAVAKGDVPKKHWTTLGRPFFAAGSIAGLRSWSGSMFEYLMPTLVLNEPHGSVLRDAGAAALREQIAYAAAQGVPWGISESAYAGRDETLAYQYAPQGVPRLALRRTPPDELVVSPYATALAAELEPHRACLNFAALEQLGARGRYGFIEALDFSHSRQASNDAWTPVATYMAHHQGMTIVALANVLLGGAAQRWGMANTRIEAVASLLHERPPREVSNLSSLLPGAPLQSLQLRAPGLLREIVPGTLAVEPTQILSNGRYSVTLRANGAGTSRWSEFGITRFRDDALRDADGSFFYVRWINRGDNQVSGQSNRLVSLTQHPAGDPSAHYAATFHADRVCFDARWPALHAHMTVWVSPEDDVEFRRVELTNSSDHAVEIELISAFEVTLTDPRADEAHPAFTNLFVRAGWLAEDQALLFERRPRLATERGLLAAHFVTADDQNLVNVSVQTDRTRWLGRNHHAGQPLAAFDAPPVASGDSGATLDTGLDPVCAMSVRLRIAPSATTGLIFATAACDDRSKLRAVIDKYRQPSHVKRASLMSATLTGIRHRALRIAADNHAAIQTLTSAIVLTLTRPGAFDQSASNAQHEQDVCDRRLLWRFGISGDRPIILVIADVAAGLGLLRSLAKALRVWSWGGIACDLIVINTEPASYQMTLHRELELMRERHVSGSGAETSGGASVTGFYLLRPDEVSADEMQTLQTLARLRLNADGRPLSAHLQEWLAQHARVPALRQNTDALQVPTDAISDAVTAGFVGDFAPELNEFRFAVTGQRRPHRPWINVLSNPAFGAQISEAGGGYTWAVNSRLNQLTAWSNDPLADTPSEWFLLQDARTRQTWSLSPSAWGDTTSAYRVAHGQGYSVVRHRRGELEITATWCVDIKASVKQVRVRLVNRGHRTQQLRLIGIMEWLMGASRTDRSTVRTSLHQDVASGKAITALMSTQRERAGGFGDGTAFLSVVSPANDAGETVDWTCDRREIFNAMGQLTLPERLGQKSGVGLDPCAALATRVAVAAGDAVERVFLVGYSESLTGARVLATAASAEPPLERITKVRDQWDQLLGATTVKTPDPLFDVMVNRWLLYQTVSCRMWAKAGFYQAGGATGFRDQLQDSMALAWAAPDMLRDQIMLCASRQFAEGDVQHWWHAPSGAGVRTHFSDDLLWLPYACAHYLRVTGDTALLDAQAPFIEGMAIPEGAEDAYYTPTVSTATASLYEHSARAIDRSLRVGVHGLPLMGSGDWNDGMNRVGHEGRGESVWLGWFLCRLVADFSPVAVERGDTARAERWSTAAEGWKAALLGNAWDGEWFKRAYFDNGEALGSHVNPEARIDLIAQAWAVLSGVAPPAMQHTALASVETHLLDQHAGLLKLLEPPLQHAAPSAGYIQAYPPGVRENGGQYSHGAVWALMAQAEYATAQAASPEMKNLAYRYFMCLSPAHRASHAQYGATYGIEPYVMAGDVYTQAPYVGRGGWSWYTGAAAWMHRAAVESIFGLRLTASSLSFMPCLPSHWPHAELTLKRDGRTMHFLLLRDHADAALQGAAQANATLLRPGELLKWQTLAPEAHFVIPTL